MTCLEFAAEVIGHLSWPVVAIAALFFLRKPLVGLIQLLERVKYKDLELHFDRKLEAVESSLDEISTRVPDFEAENALLDLSSVYPRGAILESWLEVERLIVKVARSFALSVTPDETRQTFSLQNTLENKSVIRPELAAIIRDLRVVRNGTVHGSDFLPDPDSAYRYVVAASRVATELRALIQGP